MLIKILVETNAMLKTQIAAFPLPLHKLRWVLPKGEQLTDFKVPQAVHCHKCIHCKTICKLTYHDMSANVPIQLSLACNQL